MGTGIVVDEEEYRHPRVWLYVRLLCVAVLIGNLVAIRMGRSPMPKWTGLPPEVGQAVLVLGVIIIVIHLGIHLKKAGPVRNPTVLVTEPGLYRYIRYPIHFGEMVMGLGIVLLTTDAASPFPLFLMIYALMRQCDDEDEEMLGKFGDVSVAWLTQTKRLFPLVW